MVQPTSSALFDGVSLLIVVASLVLLLRQRGSYFKPIRVFLILAFGLFVVRMALASEVTTLLRQSGVISFGYIYDIGAAVAVSAQLLAFLALTASAVTISNGSTARKTFTNLFKTQGGLNKPFMLYTAYTLFLIVVAWVVKPFIWITITRSPGDVVITAVFQDWYTLGITIIMLAFIAYPCRLMMLQSRRIRSPITSSALRLLSISWGGVGLVLLIFNVYLRLLSFVIRDLGVIISTVLFAVSMYVFRRTTLLESFFEDPTVAEIPKKDYGKLFSEHIGVTYSQLSDKRMLLEFDPSVSYETIVKSFVIEALMESETVLVVTPRSSPVYQALADQPQVRFLCTTPAVSYPKEGSSGNEILIPSSDPALLVDAVDKALKAKQAGLSIIFDVLSDLIVASGIKKGYNFVSYSLELLSNSDVKALYLLNSSAHDAEIVSAVRALFAFQIVHSAEGIRIVRSL